MTLIERTTPRCDADPGYGSLKDYIIQATGLSYYADKDDDLRHRLDVRLGETQLSCTAYLELLNDPCRGDAELDHLVEDLTVGETFFFRHNELFDGLRDTVIPDLIRRNADTRRLRIWSAGCSIGAEAYSLAIMLEQSFGAQLAGWEVSILGTDINRRFLARARAGVYHEWDFRGASRSQIDHCFVRQREGECVIHPRFHERVSFQYHNLVRHTFPSLVNNLVAFDLILCRNVLIYFSPALMRRMISQFHATLLTGGWLLVGHAEPNVELFRAFRTVNAPGAVMYQKATPPEPRPIAPPVVLCPLPAAPPRPVRPAPRAEPAVDLSSVRQLADAGDLDAAMLRCAQLIALSPMQPQLHFTQAMLAEQLGDHRQVERSLRRTLYINPDHALAHYYHGLIQQKRSEIALAGQSFRNVLQLLVARPEDEPVPDAGGMIVSELRELTRMQQEVLAA